MPPQKSYYAVIPAFVRYHPNISNGAKLLYGEITALSNERGYCWASNAYFAELYAVNVGTISRWVGELSTSGAITADVDKAAGNQRQLKITEGAISKNRHSYIEKSNDPISKNRIHNNTSNNTGNKTYIEVEAFPNPTDWEYPMKPLIDAFPDYLPDRITPAMIGFVESSVSPADSAAWLKTIEIYQQNFNPQLKSYLPEKIGTVLQVFADQKAKLEKHGTNKYKSKRTDQDVFAESAEFYRNYPEPIA